MLVLNGTFAGLQKVRRTKGRREIVISHSHHHRHDGDISHDQIPAHDHAHVRSDAAVREPAHVAGQREMAGHSHRHRHTHRVALPTDSAAGGAGVATGIGMLHGVGIESPTQIAIFVASTSVVGSAGGLALLAAWVVGLIIANAGLALVAGRGLLRPDSNSRAVRVVAIAVAAMSIALGIRYLIA